MRFLLLLCATTAFAQTGPWVIEMYQNRDRMMASRMQLDVKDGVLSGKSGKATLKGKVEGSHIDILWTEPDGDTANFTGSVEGDRLKGTASTKDGLEYTWLAYRIPERPAQPRTHEFTPNEFQRHFSGSTPLVLR